MNKTILLGAKSTLSNNTSKWLLSFIGLFYVGLGGMKIYQQGSSFDSFAWLIAGLLFLFNGLIIYSSTPWTPKIRVSDTKIDVKNKLFGQSKIILWANIQSIEFEPYTIVFHFTDSYEIISYKSNAEASIEIKSVLREVAKSKNIQVKDG